MLRFVLGVYCFVNFDMVANATPLLQANFTVADAVHGNNSRMQRFLACQTKNVNKSHIPFQLTTIMQLKDVIMPHIFKSGGTTIMSSFQAYGGRILSMFTSNHSRGDIWRRYVAFKGIHATLVKDPLHRSLLSRRSTS